MNATSSIKDFHQKLNSDKSLLQAAGQYLPTGQTLCWLIDESEAYVYQKLQQGLQIVNQKLPADLVLGLSAKSFKQLITEELSLFGLMYSDKLRVVEGDVSILNNWYSAIQQLFYRRPIWQESMAQHFHGYDLKRSFDLESQQAEAADFLQHCGFVHLKSVFSPEEVERFKLAVQDQVLHAHVGDKQSWWAKNKAGDDLCCRLTYLNQQRPIFDPYPTDSRMLQIAALAGQDLLPAGNRMDGVNCVMKHSNVVEGMADLAWHKDCDLGGHHLICPGLIVGVQLDHANADNGQLHFLAGSQTCSNTHIDENDPSLPLVAINTEPGDVTAHFCHVSHAAPSPGGNHAQRRVLYCGYYQQKLLDKIPEGMSYNDVLYTQQGGLIDNIAEG